MRTISSISHIRIDDVSHAWGGKTVLTDVSLVIDRTDRLGLIGENGAGKSTLLGIIAGRTRPDRGEVARPLSTGILLQEVAHEAHETVNDLLERVLTRVRAIEIELQDAASALEAGDVNSADRYQAALEAAESADIWTVDSRRATLLAGLGVAGVPLDRLLSEVSGGQRSRFALAAILLSRPEALVLDEPTNHLDDDAVAFLREQLRGWNGPVVFASHDRAFLDEVATGLVDIDPNGSGHVTRFGGSYTDYLAAKAKDRARWEARFAAEEKELRELEFAVAVTSREIAHNREWSDNDKMAKGLKKNTVEGQISRRIRNAQGRIDDLELSRVARPTEVLSFAGLPSGSQVLEDDGPLLELDDARVPGRLAVDGFSIAATGRLLITGPNGAGKSTLLSVLAGELRAGTRTTRKGLRTALLAQDVTWRDPSESVRAIYERAVGEKRAQTVPLAELGLLTSADLDRPAGALSQGQQRRLALAVIIARPPHLFLLDEPTNHLSLALATELEDALGSYPGAVIVASHDRWLRRRWSGPHRRMEAGSFVA
jgi:macrolide transport system ATP-binding/permease protein